jgi:tRNA pseudouridine38-40 synthase
METRDNDHAQSVPATPSLKAVVRYYGAAFAGWQVQSNERTVQGVIEEALSQIASHPVRVHGASRTDAGVHALGQVCSWQWNADADVARLRRSLCKMLGPSVRIESLEWAPDNFHPRKSAHSKRYAYVLHLARRPDPFLCRYAWTVPWRLDMDLLREMAARVTGTHDFAGFQGGGSDVRNTVRTLFSVRLEEGVVVGPAACAGSWRLVFHGDGFLYKMIRNITGTLVEIARDHLPPSRLDELLAAPGPYHGFTAPPQGLFLVEVLYE